MPIVVLLTRYQTTFRRLLSKCAAVIMTKLSLSVYMGGWAPTILVFIQASQVN